MTKARVRRSNFTNLTTEAQLLTLLAEEDPDIAMTDEDEKVMGLKTTTKKFRRAMEEYVILHYKIKEVQKRNYDAKTSNLHAFQNNHRIRLD